MKRGAVGLIEYWNGFPHVPKHLNPMTKVYKEAAARIRTLETGTIHTLRLDASWFESKKIPARFLRRKWTEGQIRDGLRELSKMYVTGYFPGDKGWLPRRLPDLLFNARLGTSWFLAVKVRGVEPLNRKFGPLVNHPADEHLVEILRTEIIEIRKRSLTGSEEMKLNAAVNRLVDFFATIPDGDFMTLSDAFPEAREFVEYYARWLAKKYKGFAGLTPGMLGPEGKSWSDFVETASYDLGVSLETGEAIS